MVELADVDLLVRGAGGETLLGFPNFRKLYLRLSHCICGSPVDIQSGGRVEGELLPAVARGRVPDYSGPDQDSLWCLWCLWCLVVWCSIEAYLSTPALRM